MPRVWSFGKICKLTCLHAVCVCVVTILYSLSGKKVKKLVASEMETDIRVSSLSSQMANKL